MEAEDSPWHHMEDSYYTCVLCITTDVRYDVTLHDIAENIRHARGKTNRDVVALSITNFPLTVIPTSIEQKFGNLLAIEMQKCGIVEITKEHLQPVKMLKCLWMQKNEITSLPEDLFIYTPFIEILSFNKNKIVHISEKTLMPLTNLLFADFRDNVNIDSLFTTLTLHNNERNIVSMETLMHQIKAGCQPPARTSLVSKYVSALWSTGMLSDFKIRTDNQEFHVHKCILAVNSPVFEAMFKHEMKENLISEMYIKDASAGAVKEFLEFVYLCKTPENGLNALDLLTIATKYQFSELRELSEQLVIKSLEVDNVFEVFVMAGCFGNICVKTAAFDFISSNMFSGWKLPTEFMEKPDKIKELIDAKKLMDEQVSNAQNEFKNVYEKFLTS